MIYKKCKKCQIDKLLSDFPKDKSIKIGYRSRCKQCNNDKCKEYYSKHKKQISKKHKEYHSLDENKEKVRNYVNNKRKNDIQYKIKDNLRRRINYAIKSGKKHNSTCSLLGCSLAEFKAYIEKLWHEGMNWNNYGMFGWHLDHIKPCSSFNLNDPEEQKKCFHYSNIQPLWAKDNWSKGSR